jgi:hypothetical protein
MARWSGKEKKRGEKKKGKEKKKGQYSHFTYFIYFICQGEAVLPNVF